jgi:hypothetical protein
LGSYKDQVGRTLELVERWDGTSWAIQRVPNPPGARLSLLTSVSCPSNDACTAIGSYRTRAGNQHMLVERWTGNS